MEPSTSQTQVPDTVEKVTIRARPQIHVAPLGPPSQPTRIEFRHPANNLPFLRLPALDYCHPTFGIHYGTAITACEILACNKKGYLSTSRNRHGDGRVNVDEDSIISREIYYYHITSPESEALYPICCDFSCWEFPHNAFPPAWKNELGSLAQTPVGWPSNWSAISEKIKSLDTQCLVSGSKDSLTTSHLVAKDDEEWLLRNEMGVYLIEDPLSYSPRNLFALRWDLHLGHFDQAGFVIVPKRGQFVVHFLQPTNEVAQQYHNVHFDHENRLSHEALYARFAWALMKHAKLKLEHTKQYFRFLTAPGANNSGGDEGGAGEEGGGDGGDGGDDGGDSGGHGPGRGGPRRGSGGKKGGHRGLKRKRDEEENKDDEFHHGAGATDSDRRSGSHVASDANAQEDGSQALSDSEARELEKDMKLAARTLPFFLDPNGLAEPGRYETLPWYPGIKIVERKKNAYLDAHPEIRAHSGQLLPDDYDSSNDEDLVKFFQFEFK